MGCFWGAERVFWQIPGVIVTAVGYQGGFTPNPSYEEVCTGQTGHTESVMVVFDTAKVSLETLLARFWEEHDPTQGMRQGNDRGTQYRSAIYTTSDAQAEAVRLSRDMYQQALKAGGARHDHHRGRHGRDVLFCRALSPAISCQEPERVLWARRHRRVVPGRIGRSGLVILP